MPKLNSPSTRQPPFLLSPELFSAFARFSSFSHDMSLISAFLKFHSPFLVSSPVAHKPQRRAKPTPRSAWREKHQAASPTETVAAPMSIPAGRREVLRALIHQTGGYYDSSESSNHSCGHSSKHYAASYEVSVDGSDDDASDSPSGFNWPQVSSSLDNRTNTSDASSNSDANLFLSPTADRPYDYPVTPDANSSVFHSSSYSDYGPVSSTLVSSDASAHDQRRGQLSVFHSQDYASDASFDYRDDESINFPAMDLGPCSQYSDDSHNHLSHHHLSEDNRDDTSISHSQDFDLASEHSGGDYGVVEDLDQTGQSHRDQSHHSFAPDNQNDDDSAISDSPESFREIFVDSDGNEIPNDEGSFGEESCENEEYENEEYENNESEGGCN